MQASPDLILLPGLDGTGLLFRPLVEALSDTLRAKVVSYPPGDALDLPSLATLVKRQLPATEVVLLAESFSGLVALTMLSSPTARVRSVIFVGAFAEPPRPLLLHLAPVLSRSAAFARVAPSFLLRYYCLGSDATAAQLKALREAIGAVSPKVITQRFGLVAGRHSFAKLRADVPVHYLRPSDDRLVPVSCAQWFQKHFKNCRIEEVEGPHFLLQARPAASARVIARIVHRLP